MQQPCLYQWRLQLIQLHTQHQSRPMGSLLGSLQQKIRQISASIDFVSKHDATASAWKINFGLPKTKDSDWFLTKKKGLRVLHLDIMVLPLPMDTIILKHIRLHAHLWNMSCPWRKKRHLYLHFLRRVASIEYTESKSTSSFAIQLCST